MKENFKKLYKRILNLASASNRSEEKKRKEIALIKGIQDLDYDELAIKKSKYEGKFSSNTLLAPFIFSGLIAAALSTLVIFTIRILSKALPILSGYKKVSPNQLLELKYFLVASLGVSFILIIVLISVSIAYFKKRSREKMLLDLYTQEIDRRKNGQVKDK